MRVALVLALAAVAFRESDTPVGDTVDGADVDAVRANHFHVLGDPVRSHLVSPLVLPIALELDVLRQRGAANCQRVRREEIAGACAGVSRRRHARAVSQTHGLCPSVKTSPPCRVLNHFTRTPENLGKRFTMHTL